MGSTAIEGVGFNGGGLTGVWVQVNGGSGSSAKGSRWGAFSTVSAEIDRAEGSPRQKGYHQRGGFGGVQEEDKTERKQRVSRERRRVGGLPVLFCEGQNSFRTHVSFYSKHNAFFYYYYYNTMLSYKLLLPINFVDGLRILFKNLKNKFHELFLSKILISVYLSPSI